jgi:hypothetical protein
MASADTLLNVNASSFEPSRLNANAAPFWPLDSVTQRQRRFTPESGVTISSVVRSYRQSLPKATPAADGDDACVICFENVPDCKFPGCSHGEKGFICAVCADKIVKSSKKCPMCRAPVAGVSRA